MKTHILQSIKTIILALILAFGVQVASAAWTSAPASAPAGNVDAPLNVGSITQRKLGQLQVNTGLTYAIGLISSGISYFNGNVGIGTNAPSTQLEVVGQVKITGGSPGAGKVLVSDATGLASWSTASAAGTYEYECISPSSGQQYNACFQLNKTTGNVAVRVATDNANGSTGAANNVSLVWGSTVATINMNLTSFSNAGSAPYTNLIVTNAAAGSSFPTVCVIDSTETLGCVVASNWAYSSWTKLAKPF